METEDFVPIIDIGPLFGNDAAAKNKVAKQIDRVCRGSGFFYISNHGIDLNDLYKKVTHFHTTISEEEKQRIAIRAWNPENVKQIRNGYQPPTKTKPVEMFCYLNPEFSPDHPAIKDGLPGHEVNVWPKEAGYPGFREFCENYYRNVSDVTEALLKGFSLALGKGEDFFANYYRKSDTLSSVVLIRYPYLEDYPPRLKADDGTELGYGAHQDVDLIVVLAQTDIQNLQAETPDGTFKDVPPSDQHFLVNVGTYMDHITNGVYRAVWHRVKHCNIERLSIPYFVNLGYNDEVKPFYPREEDDQSNDCNAPIKYGEYMTKGLKELIKSNGQR